MPVAVCHVAGRIEVFNETCTKVWGRIPGIRIDIEELEETN